LAVNERCLSQLYGDAVMALMLQAIESSHTIASAGHGKHYGVQYGMLSGVQAKILNAINSFIQEIVRFVEKIVAK